MSRFSSTLSSRSLVMACGITPIERRTPSGSPTTSKPATRAVPDVGGIRVVSMRMSVDLPAPFGPSRPKISPCATEKPTASTAVKSPKRFVIRSTSMSAMRASLAPGRSRPSRAGLAPHRQQHVGGHADRQTPVAVVDTQAHLEGLDVPLRAAHVPLGGEPRVHGSVEHHPRPLDAGGKAHGERLAEPDGVD